MELMLITNKVDIAEYSVKSGVSRIFIDLEVLGKHERQGHLDTVISEHSLQDVGKLRNALIDAEILVRINPLHDGTQHEIDSVIEQGADIIMLPMFHSKKDIDAVGKMINNRARFIPLIETKSAAENLQSYVESSYVSEFYIGLNDLHRELGYKFMFQILSDGYLDDLVDIIKKTGKPFGFGGIARIGEGMLPARLILAEHVRLGSSSVILSRSFHQRATTLEELKSNIDLPIEIEKIYRELAELKLRDELQVINDHKLLSEVVERIAEDIK